MTTLKSQALLRHARAPAFSSRGMVVSGHSLASLAGIRTLQRGGNLTDALVAALGRADGRARARHIDRREFCLLHHDAATGSHLRA